MARKFRHQDISVPGAGTKVRTVHAGKHELRIAFPRGARKKGSGKIVSILHPKTEKNPSCGGTLTVADVAAFEIPLGAVDEFGPAFEGLLEPEAEGQNPSGWQEKWDALRSKIASFIKPKRTAAIINPKRRAKLTPDEAGEYDRLMEFYLGQNYSDSKADRAAWKDLQAKFPRLKGACGSKNPKGKRHFGRDRRNLDEIDKAAQLTEEFRGYPAEKITESGEPNKMRDDFAHLGWTMLLVFVGPNDPDVLDCEEISDFYNDAYERSGNLEKAWREVQEEFGLALLVYDVSQDEIRLVSSADRKQLYFIGGNQKGFREALGDFDTDQNRDRVDLGRLLSITYSAQKVQLGDTEERGYYHVFGEEGGYPPGAFYDTLNDRIFMFGGTYHLEEAERGIIN